MKRKTGILSLLIAFVLVLTGCGQKQKGVVGKTFVYESYVEEGPSAGDFYFERNPAGNTADEVALNIVRALGYNTNDEKSLSFSKEALTSTWQGNKHSAYYLNAKEEDGVGTNNEYYHEIDGRIQFLSFDISSESFIDHVFFLGTVIRNDEFFSAGFTAEGVYTAASSANTLVITVRAYCKNSEKASMDQLFKTYKLTYKEV